MFVRRLGRSSKSVVLVATIARAIAGCVLLPAPAAAMGTTDWSCRVHADPDRVLTLNDPDLPAVVLDQRVFDLDCSFVATAAGPTTVTVCLAIPSGDASSGIRRSLRRQNGGETVSYRILAKPGSVPGARASSSDERLQDLRPVYTVDIDHSGSGMVSFLHQFVLLTEIRKAGGVVLPQGRYAEAIDGMTASIHEGHDCGPELWGTAQGGLGVASRLTTELQISESCILSVIRPIDFGAVSEVTPLMRADGAIGVQCSDGVAYSIEMGDGLNAQSGQRRLARSGQSGGANAQFSYQLLKPDGQEWSAVSGSVAGTPLAGIAAGSQQRIDVVARIANVPPAMEAGHYRDSVVVTLSY